MRSILNEEEIILDCNKIKVYNNEENINLSKIRTILDNINYNYDSNNAKKLIEHIFEIDKKINIIKNIHFNNIYVLEKNVEKYQLIKNEVETTFNNIKK